MLYGAGRYHKTFRCLFITRFEVLGVLLNDLIKPTRYGRKIAIYFIFPSIRKTPPREDMATANWMPLGRIYYE